jgi:hypothetical protein
MPLTVVGQQTSLSPGFVGVQPAATAASVCAASQSSLRGLLGEPAQSSSVSAPAFCLQATVVVEECVSAIPQTVVGQQTSLSPGFVGVQPAETAASVWASSQSSLRGLSGEPAQSWSVSAAVFCLH